VDDLRITRRVTIPSRDLSWSAARSGGPGGQNVNKVASKVDLRFDLPGSSALREPVKARLRRIAHNRLDGDGRVMIQSSTHREQHRNLEDARERLADMIRRAMRPPKKRKKTKPSRRQKQKRLDNKKRRSEKKRLRKKVRY